MSIQLIIEGEHVTDLLAEIQTLATALKVSEPQPVVHHVPNLSLVVCNDKNELSEIDGQQNIEKVSESKPTKLVGGEHKTEATKMIAAGEIDPDIYPLLSKKQKERVDEALKINVDEEPVEELTQAEENSIEAAISQPENEPVETPVEDKGVAGLFDDEPEAPKEEINLPALRDLISSVCRDDEGKDIPEKYAAVRDEMRKVIPSDQDVKVTNIPEGKIEELYYSISAL